MTLPPPHPSRKQALAHSFGDSDDPELSKKTTHFIRLGGVAAALEALATMRRKLAASRLDGSARPTSTAPRRDAVLAGQAAGSLLVLLRECAYTVHPVARAPRGALADAGVVAAAFALLRYPETADPARFFLDELFSLGVRPPSLGTLRWRGVDVTNVVAGLGPSALMQLSSTLAGLTFNADIQEPARVQSARSMLACEWPACSVHPCSLGVRACKLLSPHRLPRKCVAHGRARRPPPTR